MAKYSSRVISGSVALDRHSGGGQFKIWSSFSRVSFRRMILDTMRCGGGGGGEQHASQHENKPNNIEEEKEEEETEEEKAILGQGLRPEVKREKLSELLSVPQGDEEREKREAKMKMEVLENFKKVVNGLSGGGEAVLKAAMEVRRLTKDNSEARTTLALLGAIPPLVAMLEPETETSSQIAALYALLNISINTDVSVLLHSIQLLSFQHQLLVIFVGFVHLLCTMKRL